MTAAARETGAAVRFPFPPLLFVLPLLVALAVQRWVHPLDMPDRSSITATGVLLTVAGVALGLSGVATVVRHHTTVVPHHAVARLVTAGPYRISRNPMYTGFAVTYLGVTLWVGSWWPLILLPFCVLATDRLVIAAEEEYLGRRFGTEYGQYRSRVRRWL